MPHAGREIRQEFTRFEGCGGRIRRRRAALHRGIRGQDAAAAQLIRGLKPAGRQA